MTPREICSFVPWSRVLEEAGTDPGRGNRICCPVHGGDNPTSFACNDQAGTAHCFACGWGGDKIDFLQTTLSLDFRAALARLADMAGVRLDGFKRPSNVEMTSARAHKIALQSAQQSYDHWRRKKFIALCDTRWGAELVAEISDAESAFRQLSLCPDLYTEEEAQWGITRLASLYDQFATLEYSLDLLTYREHEAERFLWWKKGIEK